MLPQVILTRIKDQLLSALLIDGQIVEFQCVSPGEAQIVGNIYVGRVQNIVPNIQGAFVEYEKGQLGYLPIRNRKMKVGDEVLVQVKKEATNEKQPMLSSQIELSGKYLVLTSDKSAIGISNKIRKNETRRQLKELTSPLITEEYGFILRTSAASASPEAVIREAELLGERYMNLVDKSRYRSTMQLLESNQNQKDQLLFGYLSSQVESVITDQEDQRQWLEEDGYPVVMLSSEAGDIDRRYRLIHHLEEALRKKVWMKSGGFLYIEQTEAMAVIDVNSGKSIGKGKKDAHLKKINLEAAREAARQIRLRNLSGIIMIDFIDMKSREDQEELLHQMQYYLNQDSKKAVAVDITKLGIMEITRKKEKNPIFRQINVDNLR